MERQFKGLDETIFKKKGVDVFFNNKAKKKKHGKISDFSNDYDFTINRFKKKRKGKQ